MTLLTSPPVVRHRAALILAAAAAGGLVLAGCATTQETPAASAPSSAAAEAPATQPSTHPSTQPSTHPSMHPGDAGSPGQPGLPSEHVHGVAVNPADDRVYLATHDGLFRYEEAGPTRVGPVIDLMGFTVAGPDHFYASGHPGPGVDLPEPVGLIESTDGGHTWKQLSRQGQSDFHALAASAAGVVGFDGTALRATSDGTAWEELDPPVEPYALAASPDGDVLLATSESGPIRSTDSGATWAPVHAAPLLQVVDWAADRTVVGITPDGVVAVSDDAGATWAQRGSIDGPPQAVGASLTPGGALRVLAVTGTGVLESTDGATSFAAMAAG